MIKLWDLISETTKRQDRVRKWRMVNEDANDVRIELTGKQVKELDTIFKEFGSNLNNVLQTDLEEGKKLPDFTKMSVSQLEEMGVVLKIDKSIMDRVDGLVELGEHAKNWYAEMNKTILDAFGDSDGTLFLILLAIFSPRNKLDQNFKLAAQTFQGIKRDLANEKTKAKLENMMEMKSSILRPAIMERDEFKDLATVRGMIRGNKSLVSTLPNALRVLRLYKQNNYVFTKKDAVDEISKHMRSSGGLDKDTIVSAEKVFSFTLNLLDPNYEFEDGWLPLTMDTWMASFFYPQLTKKEKNRLLVKTSNYVYMAKLTQEIAGRYGMRPIEMQAALWVGIIKESVGKNYNTTFLTAVDKNSKKLDIKIDELKKLDSFLKQVVEVIGNAGI
jgi:hypothetical protein